MESPLAMILEHNPSIIPESQSHSPIHPQPPPQPAINSQMPPYSPPNPFPSDDIEQVLTQLALSRPEKSKKINQFYLNQHPTAIKKLETKFFHKNSKLRYIGQAMGNKMHGFGKVLYENGNIKLAGKFNRDLPDGIMAFFSHDEEKLLFSGVCQNGFKKEGKLFYTNGVMLYCGSFMADQIAGEGCEIYWDNGNVKFSGDFRGGLPFNCGKFYDRNGELVWKLCRDQNDTKVCNVYKLDEREEVGQLGNWEEGLGSGVGEIKRIFKGVDIARYLRTFQFYSKIDYNF
jgi:antitoxin component YwqK of YwqJK toxin-antitoxin module